MKKAFVFSTVLLGIVLFVTSVMGNKQDAQKKVDQYSDQQAVPIPPVPPSKPLSAAEARKAAADKEKTDEGLRIVFAKLFENSLLGQGMNVDVTTYGPRHKTLQMKYVLVSKVLAYQITENNQEMLSEMRDRGFTKFVITDGYEDRWTWTLTH